MSRNLSSKYVSKVKTKFSSGNISSVYARKIFTKVKFPHKININLCIKHIANVSDISKKISSIFLFLFRIITIFSKEVLMICPLWLYPSVTKEQMHCVKNLRHESFFSRMCQEANAMFIALSCSFLAGLELNLHRHMLSQKTSQLRSLVGFWNF